MSSFTVRPRFGKLPAAIAYSGRSRSRLYEFAEQHEGLFRKDGASTIVDFDVLDEILDQLPAADIGKAKTAVELGHARIKVEAAVKAAPEKPNSGPAGNRGSDP